MFESFSNFTDLFVLLLILRIWGAIHNVMIKLYSSNTLPYARSVSNNISVWPSFTEDAYGREFGSDILRAFGNCN